MVLHTKTVFYNNDNWLLNLDSKLLAYSHLKWVEQFLNQNNNIINNGLYWSQLNQIKGRILLLLVI